MLLSVVLWRAAASATSLARELWATSFRTLESALTLSEEQRIRAFLTATEAVMKLPDGDLVEVYAVLRGQVGRHDRVWVKAERGSGFDLAASYLAVLLFPRQGEGISVLPLEPPEAGPLGAVQEWCLALTTGERADLERWGECTASGQAYSLWRRRSPTR